YVGLWGLMAVLVPVALARQAFEHRRGLLVASEEANAKDRLLEQVDQRVEEERRDERSRVAADLHDEVLPALFKVHLMGQVLRQDLDSGRLLELEEDLPQLLDATDRASAQMRVLIATLKRSSASRGAVTPTLHLLREDMSRDSSAVIHLGADDIGGSPLTPVPIYQ